MARQAARNRPIMAEPETRSASLRQRIRLLMLPVGVAMALLSSGCRRSGAGGCIREDASTDGRAAAEQAIQAGSPKLVVQFRGVQVYRQAVASNLAVCGLMTPFADDPGTFVPFVALLTRSSTPGRTYEIRQFIGNTTADADRVYIALVDNCWDLGGPSTAPLPSMTPLPPLPDTVREHLAHGSIVTPHVASPAQAPVFAAGVQPATGRAIMRQNANLHESPQGPPIRVVEQGTSLRIFAAAPGGWYQVGDTAPWGWVHSSMLVLR